MSAYNGTIAYCSYRMGYKMTPKRFLILLVAFATTTLITAMGIVEAGQGLISGPTVAIFGLISLLLVFGVEINRIELGPIVIDFSEQKGKQDDTKD